MMYCNECGEEFPAPDIIPEYHPCGDGVVKEEFAVCPICGGSDIEEAGRCARCGRAIPASKDFALCDTCEEQIMDDFLAYLGQLSCKELDFIGWKIEGIDLKELLR